MEISFTRVALLAAALFFVGCDQKPQPAKTHATEVTVLEGKTMGTFWRASIPALTPNAVPNLKKRFRPSWTLTISCFRPIKRFRADAL